MKTILIPALVLFTLVSRPAFAQSPTLLVKSETQQPIAGARVVVFQEDRVLWMGTTNAKGLIPPVKWSGGMPSGHLLISVSHPDAESTTHEAMAAQLNSRDTFHVELKMKTFSRTYVSYVRSGDDRYPPSTSEYSGGLKRPSLAERSSAPLGGAEIPSTSTTSDAAIGPVPPGKPGGTPSTPEAGTLTATEVNDLARWTAFLDVASGPLVEGARMWNIYPRTRFVAEVQNADKMPLANVPVMLMDESGKVIWQSRTDNTGRAELWGHLFIQPGQERKNKFRIIAGESWDAEMLHEPREARDGINLIRLDKPCNAPLDVDVAFVVDATGSMGDELHYLKTEISHVIGQVEKKFRHLNFRTGAVVYRDYGDQYVTRHHRLGKAENARKFLENQQAGGGGDYPEAVEEGLAAAMDSMGWSENARARLLFLVLDAPPHLTDETKHRIHQQILRAAAKGIRIIPLACSGIDKPTEYFLRSLAVTTGGTYTALTDDSGVGNAHLTPSTDKINPQKMNDLLIKIIERYAYMPECGRRSNRDDELIQEQHVESLLKHLDSLASDRSQHPNFAWSLFPNPSRGPITVDIKKQRGKLMVLDVNGRLLYEYKDIEPGRHPYDFSHLSKGVYFMVFQNPEMQKCLRFIIG